VANAHGQWRRRDALRWGAGATLLSGAALTGCGPATTPPQQAAPAVQGNVTQLLFNPNVQGVGWNKTVHTLFQQFVDDNFNANPRYKGLNAQVTGGTGQGQAAAQVTASIAGSGYPDVVEGCCFDFPTYFGGDWLLPLDKYIKQNNIDTAIWSKRHLEALNVDGKQLGIPSYDGSVCIVYRQDLLDQLGLPYPDAGWDFQTASALWQSCSGVDSKTHKQRAGISLFFSSGDYWQKLNFWLRGWGALEANAASDRCTADSTQGVDCLTFIADAVRNKVAVNRQEVGALTNGTAVFSMVGEWNSFGMAQDLGDKYKWNILPVPTWPSGHRSTYNNIDFYGLNRASKNPDQAWELLSWLTADPAWQRFQIKTTLVSPCLLALWDEWETTVKSVAPPLESKDLHWYKDSVVQGYSWPAVFFRYATSQVVTVLDNWIQQIWDQKVSPQVGLRQMAQQIDAIQAIGPQEALAVADAAKRFPTQGATMATVQPGL